MVGRFTIERFSMKGPFYLQPQQKVASLQNKVTFYEGQLNPLHSENSNIKQNHINLSRIVSGYRHLIQSVQRSSATCCLLETVQLRN
jgi:hypothetical protein